MPTAKIESINNSAITPNDGSRAPGQPCPDVFLGRRLLARIGLGALPPMTSGVLDSVRT